jgi:D-lactate dehydrogenase (cytochrome)
MAPPVMVAATARDAAITSLSELLGDRLSTGELVRQQHGRDASYHPCMPPDAVAFAQSTESQCDRQDSCEAQGADYSFGSGSGLEGNVVALRGGVSIDLSRMNRDPAGQSWRS